MLSHASCFHVGALAYL